MSAVNDRGQPVTNIGGWEIVLVDTDIICNKPGQISTNLGVAFLRHVPADLNQLASFDYLLRAFLKIGTAEINELTDWVRRNVDLVYE